MLSGWGRVPVPGREVRSEDLEALTRDAVLCRGLGRSYGDSSLPAAGPAGGGGHAAGRPHPLLRPGHRRPARGGRPLALRRSIASSSRAGSAPPSRPARSSSRWAAWWPPTSTARTTTATAASAATSSRLRMRVADGRIVECSPEEERDLFRATVGGMGLTGHILEVECRLHAHPLALDLARERAHRRHRPLHRGPQGGRTALAVHDGLDRLPLARQRAWGAASSSRGRWAERGEAPPRPPAAAEPPRRSRSCCPGWVISRASVRAFNSLYYHRHPARVRRGIVHPESFFYPLDVDPPLEPAVRPARLHAVPVRAAGRARGTARPGASSSC